MACCNGPPAMVAAPMPYVAAAPEGGQMSPEAARHQHVINHLACREAACPQGLSPVDLAVWGARRDCFERPPCEPPVVEAPPPPQPVCVPQMCAPVDPCQPMTVPMGRSTASFTYVDFGGKYSASPEYDAMGSPHGYYGPPAALTLTMNQLQCNAPPVPPCDPCAPAGQANYPPYYGNAYPGAKQGKSRAWNTSSDAYYMMRERELRHHPIPQGGPVVGPTGPATRTVTRVVERPVIVKTKTTPRSPATRYSYAKTPS